ncbi:MAG: hopanoid-associated sugar epimerase [Acidimicrobiales bacterium]
MTAVEGEQPRHLSLQAGDRVVVTGAAGFVGSAVTRALLERGVHVVTVLQPGADQTSVDGLPVERVNADVRDAPAVREAIDGARVVFHIAALYRFWSSDPNEFYDVNVGGTLNVLDAARVSGCERVVYTSTVGTIGLDGTTDGALADERSWARIEHLFGSYKRSKYVAEHEVLRAAAEGLPVVLVQPTLPVGPRDRAPTPTGRIVLDFLNGRIPGWFETSLNVVDADDLAVGHIAALERGQQGRSYVLGGENMHFRAILGTLAAETGLPGPVVRVPAGLALGAAYASELIEGRVARRPPSVPLEGTRMATTRMIYSDDRARSELGYRSRPAREALVRSARWFADNGFVSPKRLARIRWKHPEPTSAP